MLESSASQSQRRPASSCSRGGPLLARQKPPPPAPPEPPQMTPHPATARRTPSPPGPRPQQEHQPFRGQLLPRHVSLSQQWLRLGRGASSPSTSTSPGTLADSSARTSPISLHSSVTALTASLALARVVRAGPRLLQGGLRIREAIVPQLATHQNGHPVPSAQIESLITPAPPLRTPPELPRSRGMAPTHGGTERQRGRPQQPLSARLSPVSRPSGCLPGKVSLQTSPRHHLRGA